MARLFDAGRKTSKKKNNEDNVIRGAYKDKIRSHKLTIFYRIMLAVVLLGAVVWIMYIQYERRTYSTMVTVNSITLTNVESDYTEKLGENVVFYSKDGISCVDGKGTQLWNQTFEMQSPMFDVCGNTVAIGDYNGRTIYVQNSVGTMGTINTNMPIRTFRVAANGVVATVLDDSNITWIYLYDAEGNVLVNAKTTMQESGYPVSIAISPNGQLLMVSYLYVDSGEMKSSVAFYNFGAVGQNEVDRYVSGYDYTDTVVPHVQFMGNGNAYAISDERIMFFTGAQKPISRAEILLDEELQAVYSNENNVGLVFYDTTGEETYRLDVYNADGTLRCSLKFSMDYKDIQFCRKDIVIYGETECKIMTDDGHIRYDGYFGKAVKEMIQGNSISKYTLVRSDSIDMIELK